MLNAKHKILHLLQNPDSTYDEFKEGLMGYAAMTIGTAAEAFFTGDRAQTSGSKDGTLVTQETDEKGEALKCVTVAALRAWMVPELKTYVDISKVTELQPFLRIAEEWERSQSEGTPLSRRQYLHHTELPDRVQVKHILLPLWKDGPVNADQG